MTRLLLIALFIYPSLVQDTPRITWLTPTEYDLGDLQSGQSVSHSFEFRNTSPDTLSIDNVRTACGCTAPSWSDAPILPDSTARVTVEYDARDNGFFRRYIKVYVSGQRRAEKLYISGFVE